MDQPLEHGDEDHPDREAVDLAKEIDGYLDERVDPDATSAEEAGAISDAFEGDPYFRGLVRRLGTKLRGTRK